MKILIVVGARPNFMKVAPIIEAIKRHNEGAPASLAGPTGRSAEPIRHLLVHTGQHYDDLMSAVFFTDLGLPEPDIHLGVGPETPVVQTAEVMKRLEIVLLRERPDAVVVVGDVNSTLAAAVATIKTAFDSTGSRPLIAHVEAGLRSFDRSMPEEINRIVTDHISDLFFATEESAIKNLRSEGIPSDRIYWVGNTMIDSLLAFKEKAETSTVLDKLRLRVQEGNIGNGKSVRPYAVLTLHRPSNVDNRASFLKILDGLEELAMSCPVVFPAHPRAQRRVKEFGLHSHMEVNGTQRNADPVMPGTPCGGIILTEPLGYLDFLCLMKHATLVVTDSGGIQEETTCLGIPCVTVRENTERPVTTEKGTNLIAGTDEEKIKEAVRRQLTRKGVHQCVPEKWDGQAARRIVATLVRVHQENNLACA